MDGNLYRCDRCGRIIDGVMLQTVGRTGLSMNEEWENLKKRIRTTRCSTAAGRRLKKSLQEMIDSLGRFARLAERQKRDPRSASIREIRRANKEVNAELAA
jgi:hypothetical protein